MSLSYKMLFTLGLSMACPSLQVWGETAKSSLRALRQEQQCQRRLRWILTVPCETKRLLPSTSLQKENASTWLHNILLAQLTTKIIGQLGCQDLTPFCYVSPVMLNPSWTPPVINFGNSWGEPQAAAAVCVAVPGMLLVCLLCGFAVRGSERSHWSCCVLLGRDPSNAEARAAPAHIIDI